MTPEEAPKLSPWPFLAADALLLGSAFFIGYQSSAPITGAPLFVAGALVFTGAVVAVIPWLVNHTRRQDLELRERQQEIAALAQTTAASAEQLSIAAASLHAIADSASKASRQAESLPLKLQEKIHEFKEQLNEVTVTENEALSQEVNTLRAAETERLEGLVTTIRKLSSEIARLEAASRQHVSDLTEALNRFTSTAEKSAADATATITTARASAETALTSAHTTATKALESAIARTVADLESRIAALTADLTNKVQQATESVDTRLAKLEAAPPRAETEPAPRSRARRSAAPEAERMDAPSVVAATPDKSHAGEPTVADAPPVSAATAAEAPRAEGPTIASAPSATSEASAPAATLPTTAEEPAKLPRKTRAAKRNGADNELTLDLDLPPTESEYSQVGQDNESASAVSADGATRLIVTSYIGIGNKLYVRGEAPGLSWERGVPLQFVSIGKWRWESPDVTESARLKLYKNDEIECTALGEILLEPGHQREVSASF